jgi:transcriptional regulator with XRE-family HTH domain
MANIDRLGPVLVALLARAGMNQAELARKSKLAASVINRAFKGHGSPSLETLELMLTAMGMSLYDLAAEMERQAGGKSQYPGRVRELYLETLLARGYINDDVLFILASAYKDDDDHQWAPDFKASVAEAGKRFAARAIEEVQNVKAPPKKK